VKLNSPGFNPGLNGQIPCVGAALFIPCFHLKCVLREMLWHLRFKYNKY